jgi:hypothetical protein
MSDYSVSNFFTQLQTVYGLNIMQFLQNKTLNYSNYIFFGVFLLVRLIALYFLSYQISTLNVILMILQSILLLGVGHILYNIYENIKLGKQSAIIILIILLVTHCIIMYIMNLLFQKIDSDSDSSD